MGPYAAQRPRRLIDCRRSRSRLLVAVFSSIVKDFEILLPSLAVAVHQQRIDLHEACIY